MDQLKLSPREAIFYLTLIGIGIGLVLGLIPLVYGWMKGKTKLGLIGLFVSIISGAIWSVLPVFVMIIFLILIVRKPDKTVVPDGHPAEISSIDSE